jgi:CSLREA domain-containing protein
LTPVQRPAYGGLMRAGVLRIDAARLIGTLAASLLVTAALALPAAADGALLQVTKQADTADGTCDADCSLREAVILANSTPDNDTIVLPAGTFTLTIPGVDEDASATGDLDVLQAGGELAVVGSGRQSTTIDGGGIDRVFDALSGALFELRDLTVTGGNPLAAAVADDRHGGGLRNLNGRILLSRVTFTANTAHSGGAIQHAGSGNPRLVGDLVGFVANDAVGSGGASGSGGGIFNDGTATDDGQVSLVDSDFISNSAKGVFGRGGAIFSGDNGHVTLVRNRVTGNSIEDGNGGAILNQNSSLLTIVDSEISGNEAGGNGNGGAVYNQNLAGATIVRTSFDLNKVPGRGGTLFNQNHAHMTVVDSTLMRSESGNDGGAMFIQNDSTVDFLGSTVADSESGDRGGGIFVQNTAVLNLVRSSISGNRAPNPDPAEGGGGILLNNSATLNMHESTVAGNSTGAMGGGIGTSASNQDPVVRLVNSTVSGNSAALGGGGIAVRDDADLRVELGTIADNSAPDGGGVLTEAPNASVALRGTLIARNQAPSGPDCSGPVMSEGFNLDSGTSCGLSGPGDISNGDAGLGGLADNGGPTATHLIGQNGDAFDAAGQCDRAADQRGVARPQGASCDIGAVELVPDTQVLAPVLLGQRRQRPPARRLAIRVRVGAGEPVRVVVSGRLVVRGLRGGVPLRQQNVRVPSGNRRVLVLVPRNARAGRRALNLLRRGRPATARINAGFTDDVGNTARRNLVVRLLRPR